MHCAEAPKDLEIYRQMYNCSPVEFCQDNNLIGKGRKTVLAHMVNLDLPKDLAILRDAGASVAHNPASNCKLASGIAAVPDMLDHGVNVALGTDGAPCNNTYDMFQEMRLAGLIHKGYRKDAAVMSGDQILEMATINAAKALGLQQDIGSLEVGKKADFVVVGTCNLSCAPFDPDQVLEGGIDPVTMLVYSCTGADVEMVVVDGAILVEARKLVRADEDAILAEAQKLIRRIRTGSGVKVRRSRNYV